jgi:hypothetical protein
MVPASCKVGPKQVFEQAAWFGIGIAARLA